MLLPLGNSSCIGRIQRKKTGWYVENYQKQHQIHFAIPNEDMFHYHHDLKKVPWTWSHPYCPDLNKVP